MCACEALDFQAVVEAMEATKSTKAVGAAKAEENEEKAASKCCTSKLAPLAVCAHTAINDPAAAPRIMRLLLDADADPNVQCDMGLTPLHWASTPAVARILLANGAAAIIVRALEKGAGRAALTTLVRDAHRDEHGARPDTGRVALDVDRCLADLAAEGLLDHAQL